MKNSNLLTVKEVAEIFGVTTPTLRNWAHNGYLVPDIMLPSGRSRYTKAQIDAFLANGGIKYTRN